MSGGVISSGAAARAFVLAGDARVTLRSQRTGARFTFRVTKPEEKSPHFVALLSGPDNGADFTFLGTIFTETAYRHGKKSGVSEGAPSARAWAWAWGFLARGELPPECEVWHEGKCGRCGRALTDPASIETGIGPVCADK